MRYLQSCCCGCTLKKGALIIGYLNLVFGAIFLLASSILFDIASDPDSTVNVKITINGENVTTQVLLAFIAISAPVLLVYLLLVIGAHKERKWLLAPYIILHIILLIGVMIMMFVPQTYGEDVAPQVAMRLFSLVLNVYYLMVIVSFFKELEGKDVSTWKNFNNEEPVA